MCFQPQPISFTPHARGLSVNQFGTVQDGPFGRLLGSINAFGTIQDSRGLPVGRLGLFGEIQDDTACRLLRRYPWES